MLGDGTGRNRSWFGDIKCQVFALNVNWNWASRRNNSAIANIVIFARIVESALPVLLTIRQCLICVRIAWQKN